MSVVDLTTQKTFVLSLPLRDLGQPKYLRPVLEFIASDAPPCIAEAVMGLLTFNLQQLTGCTRARALTFLNKLLRFIS